VEIPRAERIREHFLIDVVCDPLDDFSIVFIIAILLLTFLVVYFDATFSFPHAPQSLALSLSRTSTSTS